VDPRDPLPSGAERPAEAEAEGDEHLRKPAPLLAEDEAGPEEDEADSVRGRLPRGALPGERRLGEEAAPDGLSSVSSSSPRFP
jgi:hypothetical protein